MMSGVRVYSHPAMLEHQPGSGHPEAPERLRVLLAALHDDPDNRLEFADAPQAERAVVERVHPGAYLDRLDRLAAAGGGVLDADTVMSAGSFVAALHAAGAAVAAAGCALGGVPAFAAVRPPGHHALADHAMGFCLLNNIVIAANAMLEDRGLERVLIVDWDVHHGNGTQALVEHEPRIRYVSLHQWPLYPGTGRAEETGVGNVFNVPRPPGRPRAEYVAALDAAVTRATERWLPQLILVSAGFDAMAGDPLAGFTLEPEDYAEWIARWRGLGAPIASVLEGGYVPRRIADAAIAHLAAL
jgi:acetoin utilization deacetylase AcuC-like enzyme